MKYSNSFRCKAINRLCTKPFCKSDKMIFFHKMSIGGAAAAEQANQALVQKPFLKKIIQLITNQINLAQNNYVPRPKKTLSKLSLQFDGYRINGKEYRQHIILNYFIPLWIGRTAPQVMRALGFGSKECKIKSLFLILSYSTKLFKVQLNLRSKHEVILSV